MSSEHHPDANAAPRERRYWLDDMRNVDKLVYTLYAICVFLLLIDVFVPKHGLFAIEHWFGFYGIYGLVACVGLVLAARALRVILIRPEGYYDR